MKKFFKLIKLISFNVLIIFEAPKCQIFENFNNDNLTNWQFCNETHWKIDTTKNVLFHIFDNDTNGYELISYFHNKLKLDSAITEWSFKIHYPINSSSDNKWYFLISNNKIICVEKFTDNFSGYAFGINLTGNDNNLKFWKINNGNKIVIKDLNFNWNSNNLKNTPVIFYLERNKNGLWYIYFDSSFYQNSKILLDSFYEKSYNELISAGFYYQYTKTRDKNFYLYFLNINGYFYINTSPPECKKYEFFDKTLRLFYDKLLYNSYIPQINLLMSNLFNTLIDSIIVVDNHIDIIFNNKLPENLLITLEVKYVSDLYGNYANDTIITIENYETNPNDIIITEIMVDPYPIVKLPECEYIEIYNRSNKKISLNKWILKISSKKYYIPDIFIDPKEYIIITNKNCYEQLKTYGKVIEITNMTSINNEGCEIALYDKNEKLINTIFFDLNYYKDSNKKSGGWSIEIINKDLPCEGKKNWSASINPNGGTPGKENSVSNVIIFDNNILKLNKIFVYNDSTLWLIFNKIIVKIDTTQKKYYVKNFAIPNKINIYNQISNILELTFSKKFESNRIYTFVMNTSVEDCSGNNNNFPVELNFQKSEEPNYNDIIFSEILFSPYEADGEFLEIYNNSAKSIDLNNCLIGIENKDKTIKYYKPINYPYPINPYEYIAFTKDLEKVTKFYKCSEHNIIETNNIPILSDDGRCLFLYNKDTVEIDKFCYNKNIYPDVIKNIKGISIEKNINCKNNENIQWNCSSFLLGATPGMSNSQECENEIKKDRIEIDNELFSPDGDGINDEINFNLIFKNSENICNAYIFNSSGTLTNILLKNQVMGINNQLKWDGKTIYGNTAPIGIYIILVEYYNTNGEIKQMKKSFYLTRKIY